MLIMVGILKFLELRGCRIKFETCDGPYEGDLTTVNSSWEKTIIHNCVYLPENRQVGTLFLSFRDVFNVDLISQSRVKKNFPPSGLERSSTQCAKSSEMNIKDFIIFPTFKHLPTRVFLITSYGEELKRAIDDLKMSSVIGISLEGPLIGRYGVINWLCASSKNGTYLFDLQELGTRVFDLGLRRILESSSIEKVIHDCRQVSDALFHIYGTKLAKVFDTQTSEAFVNLQMSRAKFQGYVNSLDICLQKYLNISEDYLPQPAENIPYPQKVKSSLLRPVGVMPMCIMIKNVVYLLSLREELKRRMLSPFRGGVETYLKAVASKSDKELRRNPYDATRIPAELLVEDKFGAVKYKETRHVPLNETFNLPYPEGYSIVNKLNELRKQNPHSSAEEIHSKMPKVHTRRGACNYPDSSSGLDLEFRCFSGIESNPISNEFESKKRVSNAGVSFIPESSRWSGEKHSTSIVKKELSSSLKFSGARPLKNTHSNSCSVLNKPMADENIVDNKAETSKPLVDSVVNREIPMGLKKRITSAKALKMIQLIINEKENPPCTTSQVQDSDSQKPIPSESKQCPRIPSASRCETEIKTTQDTCDEPQYEVCDYNTVCYKDDGSFSYLPRKRDPSYDPDNPWAVFKSKYPEEESVSCNRSMRLIPAGHD